MGTPGTMGSLGREMLSLQSRWFIHSFISVGVPRKGALPRNTGKMYSYRPGAPCGREAYIQWGVAWFPMGIVNDTAVTIPVPCSHQHDTFHLGLGIPEPRLRACYVNPEEGIPSTSVTAFHVTHGRVRIHVTVRYGRGVGFAGGKDSETSYVFG